MFFVLNKINNGVRINSVTGKEEPFGTVKSQFSSSIGYIFLGIIIGIVLTLIFRYIKKHK